MSTGFQPIDIPPGVVSMPTKKMRSSNWCEVNLVRWREGQLTPMGGQAQLTNVVGGVEKYRFASRCKKIHGWFGIDGIYHIAYLCEQHLYVDTGGTLTDITPVGMAAPTGLVGGYGEGPYSRNVLIKAASAWTTASTTITLANSDQIAVGHGVYDITKQAFEGDPAAFVGVVQSVAGTVVTLTATAAIAGAAGDLLDFDWYGKERAIPGSVAVTKIPDAYSLDNFGSILYAMTSSDSRLLMWDPAVGGPAVVQPPSGGAGPVPHGRCFVVTQERFLVIFGSTQDGTPGTGGSPRRFAWCDQENPGAWDYSNVTSQAGFLDIEPASPIIAAIATRSGILIWTAKKAYVSQFLGMPYIFNYVELGDACTPWSPQSVSTTASLTLWMAEQGLFSFDGTSIAPVACKIRPWIDDDIDPIAVRELSFSCHMGEFNEWWWFFPTLGSPFNTRAAVYSYKEGWWSEARMSRSAGITSSYTAHPIFADDYIAIQHEIFQAPSYINASMPVELPFAETFNLSLTSGARLTTVKQLMPDIEAVDATDPTAIDNIISSLRYSLFYRNSRSLGGPELQSPQVAVRSNGYVDFRRTGRDIRLRIDVATPIIQPFTLGQHLIDAVPRGDR